MKILSIEEAVAVDGVHLYPMVRYVLPDDVSRSLVNAVAAKNVGYAISSFNAYERRYGGQEKGRLAFFRHTAWGDQLMATAVVNAVKTLRPNLRVDVFCSNNVLSMWEGVAKAYPAPMHFDAMRAYNYHAFYEGMLENNGEPDQNNAIDDMLGFIGVDPNEVPDSLKVPVIHEHINDFKELNDLNLKRVKDVPYVLIQLQASNPNRTYPSAHTLKLVLLLLEATDLTVILVGQEKDTGIMTPYAKIAELHPEKFINLVNKLSSFRSHVPLVKFAKACVVPDSSIGHLVAAFPKVPCVSLWGLFHPNDRVKYYKNHHPLVGFDVCPHAPCHNHEFKLPQAKCKDASNATMGEQKFCNALRSITPEMVMDKLAEVML